MENVVAVLVFGDVEGAEFAIDAAGRNDRHLEVETDEALEDRRLTADRVPSSRGVGAGEDLHLTLAVVAEAARLQHARQREAVVEGSKKRVAAGDVGEIGGAGAELAGQRLLVEPVLRASQRLDAGAHGNVLRQ